MFLRAVVLWTFLGAAGISAVAAPSPPQMQGVLIDTVTITGNLRTRTEIVRRELLFKTGDILDTNLVAESARNLRRLPYLGEADIDIRQRGQSASAIVTVDDLYSRALSPQFAGDLDELSYGLIGLDYNFLGRGQTVELSVHHNAVSGNSASAFYRIPRVGDRRLRVSASAGAAEEGHDLGLSVSQPFYALSSRWAYGLSATSSEAVQRLYDREQLEARYADRLDRASLWLRHSRGDPVKVRPSLRLGVSDRRFAAKSSDLLYAPTDRRRILPSAGLVIWKPRYVRTTYVHALGRTEDLQTGSWLSASITASARALGSDRNFNSYQFQLAPRYSRGKHLFSFATLYGSSRREAGAFTNRHLVAQLRTYGRLGHHSLALRLRFDAIDRTEDSTQLLLGVLRGLRGYAPRRFDGNRRLLINLEGRPTIYRHPLFVVAAALFLDGGGAWSGEEPVRVQYGLGAGGRLGLPRVYNTPVLRADLAYGAKDGSWQLSFGIGQYF